MYKVIVNKKRSLKELELVETKTFIEKEAAFAYAKRMYNELYKWMLEEEDGYWRDKTIYEDVYDEDKNQVEFHAYAGLAGPAVIIDVNTEE